MVVPEKIPYNSLTPDSLAEFLGYGIAVGLFSVIMLGLVGFIIKKMIRLMMGG